MTIDSWKFHLFHFFFMVESFITLAHVYIQGKSYRLIRYFCCGSLAVCIWILALPTELHEFPTFVLWDRLLHFSCV